MIVVVSVCGVLSNATLPHREIARRMHLLSADSGCCAGHAAAAAGATAAAAAAASAAAGATGATASAHAVCPT